jgi:hypothetical protein
MRRTAIALFALVALTASLAIAQPDDTGFDPRQGDQPGDSPQVYRDCSILYYHGSSEDATRLQGLGYDVTMTQNPADLELSNLASYDALVLFLIFPGELGSYQDDIEQFVSVGGALYIHQPNAPGTVVYAPTGFEVTIADEGFSTVEPCIVDPGHPITSGLANIDVSGVYDQVGSIGPGYTNVLVEHCAQGFPALALGEYGGGLVVFDVSHLATGTIHPPSDAFVVQLMDYICQHGTVSTQAESWSQLKGMFD